MNPARISVHAVLFNVAARAFVGGAVWVFSGHFAVAAPLHVAVVDEFAAKEAI